MIRDDFAGPGGWSEGLRMLGRTDEVGIEWDWAACETAAAAGHKRICADVSTYPSDPFRGKLKAYIASPSCTLFSTAGKGSGRDAIAILNDGVVRIFAGEDCREEIRQTIYTEITLEQRTVENEKRSGAKKWTTERVESKAGEDAFIAALVLEPARVIADLLPPVVALEQVPPVLPIWQVYVRELRKLGYSAWTGVLCAADYGVPQTRRRAIVMASLLAPVHPPTPTHSEHGSDGDLFGDSREKWVSMAHALGWGLDGSVTPARGAGMTERHGDRNPHPASASAPAPAPAIISKTRSWVVDRGTNSKAAQGGMAPTVGVGIDRPAPTVTSKSGGQWAIREDDHPKWLRGYRTDVSRQNAEGSVKVTVAEGGVLQSFRPDYEWQGSRTKQYEQVGNAVPPRLAAHVMGPLLGIPNYVELIEAYYAMERAA